MMTSTEDKTLVKIRSIAYKITGKNNRMMRSHALKLAPIYRHIGNRFVDHKMNTVPR